MTEQKKRGRWKPGQSGNPKGRTPGTGDVAKLRAAIANHVPDIISRLVDAARSGDVAASRLLLERVVSPVKASEAVQEIEIPQGATLTAQGRAILMAVAGGEISPSQAAQLLSAIASLSRVVEIDELAARITELESKYEKP